MKSTLAFLVAARRSEIHELEQLARSCELVQLVGELVHRLQGERGASNLFLASAGVRFGPERKEHAEASRSAEAAVRAWLGRPEIRDAVPGFAVAGGARLFTRIALALHRVDMLPDLREAIVRQRCSVAEATAHFRRTIAALLALVFEAADVAADPAISRLLVALFNLMQGKELAGQERALGTAVFAAKADPAVDGPPLLYLIEGQEACFQRFEAFSPEDVRTAWRGVQQAMPLVELERLRRKLLADGQDAAGVPERAQDWFACCSLRLDRVREVEVLLGVALRTECLRRSEALQADPDDPQRLASALDGLDGLDGLDAAGATPGVRMGEEGAEEGRAGVLGLEGGAGRPAVPDPMGPRLAASIVDVLHAQSRRLQAMTDELAAVRASLEERKLVERAKGVLMRHQGLAEDEAYRLLRQTAMNQGRRIVEVAEAALAMEAFLSGRS
ncbi:MAG: nitrate- and nitrite sensing domain-containing protein [Thauera sp.]|jgi:hypothetical protein|nr:nitrate- and nitrite sensing domain-containing protein [Thauera sp.]